MKINGNNINLISPIPLVEFLSVNGYDPERIAVELNGDIVPKKEYADAIIKDSDSLEIVSFVGGG
ncbi:MAG: sulfur carrier protein ThiS [Candidatus Methanomethylophilaceae archaeon]